MHDPTTPRELREWLGWGCGYALGCLTASVTYLRRSRMFHPRGILVSAEVLATAQDTKPLGSDLSRLAKRLEGSALLRFSSAWWKNDQEWIDALGLAVRFQGRIQDAPKELFNIRAATQDILFATIRYPWTTLLAPFTTNQHDFVANTFFAVSPFDLGDGRLLKFRLIPCGLAAEETPEGQGAGTGLKQDSAKALYRRRSKLFSFIDQAGTYLALEVCQLSTPSHSWHKIAEIHPIQECHADQDGLFFSAFRCGMGVYPRGFVHFLRVGVYRLSQAARQRHSGA